MKIITGGLKGLMIQIMVQTSGTSEYFPTYECMQHLKKGMPVDGTQKCVACFNFVTSIKPAAAAHGQSLLYAFLSISVNKGFAVQVHYIEPESNQAFRVCYSISIMALLFILETFRATNTNKLSVFSSLCSLNSDLVA